jgi:hypothetical protein
VRFSLRQSASYVSPGLSAWRATLGVVKTGISATSTYMTQYQRFRLSGVLYIATAMAAGPICSKLLT